MGHKVNPISFRLPLNKAWQSKWFADKDYADLLHHDIKMRAFVMKKAKSAGIESVIINRKTDIVEITIRTAKPGILIGRGGTGSTEMRLSLEKMSGKKVRVNIEEVKKADASAPLVAQSIASQIERRISYRRAMKQAIEKSMQAGTKGIKILISGRLNGAEIARSEMLTQGSVTLATLRSDIDYHQTEAHTTYGVIGVKVWIYKGESNVATQEG